MTKNSGFTFPLKRLTVNLASAGLPKEGFQRVFAPYFEASAIRGPDYPVDFTDIRGQEDVKGLWRWRCWGPQGARRRSKALLSWPN